MSVLPVGMSGEAGAYQITRSLRFNSADSANLSRTFSTNGTNLKIRTLSFWLKRTTLATSSTVFQCWNGSSNYSMGLEFNSSDQLYFTFGGTTAVALTTSQVFRDLSSWYHIVVAIDTTQSTDSNRVKFYVNGIQVTAFASATYPAQNADSQWCLANANNKIGSNWNNTAYMSMYLTEIHFIDGQALTPSSFGETDTTTGVWKPKQYTGSYGTNGFNLKFADNSGTTSTTLGKDSSSNGNNWTPNNFSVTAGAGNDSLVDTPTPYGTDTGVGGEVRGNYCTLNPLNANSSVTLSNGNLNLVTPSSGYGMTYSTFGMSSGKWYWEVTVVSNSGGADIGINKTSVPLDGYMGQNANSWAYLSNANKRNNNSASSYGASFTDNDVIGVALDLDAGTLVFYKNGASQGTAYSSLSGEFFPAFSDDSNGAGVSLAVNFGQRPFAYTAPSGFKALCTQNLPTPTVVQGDDYFNTVLYTGTGSTQSITSVGFQPDFVWFKNRGATNAHALFDSVRGRAYGISSNTTDAEFTSAAGRDLASFDSTGFTVGQPENWNSTNISSGSLVAWNWNAGGSTVTNTAGTISAQVRANQTAGFSVVTFTAASGTSNFTVGHGLGATPSMVIVKSRSNGSAPWYVYHASLATNNYLRLNTTNAATSDTDQWGAGMTSTVIGLRAGYSTVASTDTVAYCFAPVAGYSAFGSYTGNGSADGPFVYTGFRPAWVLFKRTNTTASWVIFDAVRNTYNVIDKYLYPDLSLAEQTASAVDFTSSGFKLRSTNAELNASGSTYLYAAFSQNPFKYSLAR